MSNNQMRLSGRRIAALVTDGFEQSELTEPVAALKEAGAEVDIIAPNGSTVRAWNHTDWGSMIQATAGIDEVDARAYDALLLPGGVMSPDHLRMNQDAVDFVRSFARAGKPIAAICHGPWTLINAGAVEGREMTSYPSLKVDLENAGAHWVDREVVIDGKLVTSRKPDDLPAFNRAMIDVFAYERTGNAKPPSEHSERQLSTAPNQSFAAGAGSDAFGDDPAALAGNTLGNDAYPEGNIYPQEDREPVGRSDRRESRKKRSEGDAE